MEIFSSLPAHAQTFVLAMVVLGLYVHLFAFNAKAAAHGPAIFTTLGIFATFLGIALGLLNFDVGNVQKSVPALLEGLKTAFWASVFGVGIALTLKIRYAMWGIPVRYQSAAAYDTSIDDLVAKMGAVQQALVGEGEATLLTQLRLGRREANERLDALKRSQEAFMEKMADNNSKALIQALEAVMRDFNAKINEQFGDNFKQLNQAVDNILQWQERYRLQMGEMIEQQKQTTANMTTATLRYGELLNKTEKFAAAGERLATLIEAMQVQRQQIERSLQALGQLLSAASTGLPDIEKRILQLAEQLDRGVRAANDATLKLIQGSNQEFNTHIAAITEQTRRQIEALDVALETELTNALDTLGRQLAALSQQFVEDYKPLTERLRQVLSLGRGV